MPLKPQFGKKETTREGGFTVSDVKLLSQETASSSAFASEGYEPDNWKGYIEFRLCHSMPVVAGPLASGNFTAYHPAVIARSYKSLLHQQMNLHHRIKSYNPKVIPRDRIVGAVVAVKFPEHAARQVPKSKEEAVPITALAAIFKQAEGVPKMLGDHLASRETWSVSLEMAFSIVECGIFLPSDGSLTPIMEAGEDIWRGISRKPGGGLRVGKRGGKESGEQMVVAPGCTDGTIEYQGVGFTPTPAEWEAEIDSVRAEMRQDGMMAIAASMVPLAMFPRGVRWFDAASNLVFARVLQVHAEGEAKLGRDRREAKPGNPILHCRTKDGIEVLRSLRSVLV